MGTADGPITPVRVDVPRAALDDLAARLDRVRWPADGVPEEGLDRAFLRDLVDHWRHRFDWRAAERDLNRRPHVLVDVGGVRVHAVHARGHGPDPMPLVLTHGWPSTFAEFDPVIDRLTDPAAHGGDPADACHVVVPSLPGFGFSDPLPPGRAGLVTDLWVGLMRRLGYERFAAHGGDIGAFVTNRLAVEHPERLFGVHTGFPAEPPAPAPGDLTEEERLFLERRRHDRETGGAYAHVHRTRPLTLAYGLSDSPVGLAAWILDKWRDWTDCDGDLTRRFSHDQLLTVVTLYWLTGTIGTSFRFYREWGLGADPALRAAHHPLSPPGVDDHPLPPGRRVPVPAAVALFKARFPRRFVERAYTDLRRFTDMPRGGHFPALEEPRALAADLLDFLRPLRRSTVRSGRF